MVDEAIADIGKSCKSIELILITPVIEFIVFINNFRM